MDPHCFDADPDPDPAQNLDADPDPDPVGGCRSAKNVHPPWQSPRYAPGTGIYLNTRHFHNGQIAVHPFLDMIPVTP